MFASANTQYDTRIMPWKLLLTCFADTERYRIRKLCNQYRKYLNIDHSRATRKLAKHENRSQITNTGYRAIINGRVDYRSGPVYYIRAAGSR